MRFFEYEQLADSTAIYPDRGNNLVYPVLGLNGEAGEIAEKMKKIIRDKGGVASDDDILELVKELGDVLWYLAACAFEIGVDLDTIARVNYDKLSSRMERNKLQGSGDNR